MEGFKEMDGTEAARKMINREVLLNRVFQINAQN